MTNLADDYDRITHTTGYTSLDGWTCLSFGGKDRAQFLHNLCTNSLTDLPVGHNREAFITDVKGHILGHGLFVSAPNEMLFWTVPGQADPLTKHFNKYLITEDVLLQDCTEKTQLLLLGSASYWKTLSSENPTFRRQPGLNAEISIAGTTARVINIGWFGPGTTLLACGRDVAVQLTSFLQDNGATRCDAETANVLRIENGTPLFNVDFGPENLPQEINRDPLAISFTKGCYLGQETIARIDALGHVNRLLVRVQLSASADVPPRGTTLHAAGKGVGQISSAVWSPRAGAPLALALVRRDFHHSGTMLDSSCGPVRVTDLAAEPSS